MTKRIREAALAAFDEAVTASDRTSVRCCRRDLAWLLDEMEQHDEEPVHGLDGRLGQEEDDLGS